MKRKKNLFDRIIGIVYSLFTPTIIIQMKISISFDSKCIDTYTNNRTTTRSHSQYNIINVSLFFEFKMKNKRNKQNY